MMPTSLPRYFGRKPMRYRSNDKSVLRAQLLADRQGLPAADRDRAGRRYVAIAAAVPELAAASVVCCYHSFGTEPPTGPLLAWLTDRGARVLLPVLRPDLDLEWAEYRGEEQMRPTAAGPFEPTGPLLGMSAIEAADAVVAPGLAVDRAGVRLGRGGGSYDRALARARPDAFVAVLLYDGELVNALPHEPHDRRVSAVVTPTGLVRIGSDGQQA
jgi:5-formyltetrahydrofolate cyclo-ligase